MHSNDYCSTIYNRQGIEATWMSTNRRMDKEDVVHVYNGTLLSPKKEWNCEVCRDIGDLETVIQNEVSQKEKNKHCIILFICGIKKNDTDELICKAEIETHVDSGLLDIRVGSG